MVQPFEIVIEGEYTATPEQVYDAVTAETAGWLFPFEIAPGTDLIAERPYHHLNRMEGENGWFNELEQVIERRDHGSSLRWRHSSVFLEGGEEQTEGVRLHTEFYLHTLGVYLKNFRGRPVVFTDIQGPEASSAPGSFETVRSALGVKKSTRQLDHVTVAGATAIVDYSTPHFVGLRTDTTLIRFFGRDAFGGPVGITVHEFGDAGTAVADELRSWLAGLFA